MAIQKYPVGLQDFGGIINNGYVYVDKTKQIHNLVTTFKYYFLSRPRRFGKSLLISTLECVFKGQKELFKGFYIEDKWAFEEYPIIRISFSNIGYRELGLEYAIKKFLKSIAESYELIIDESSVSISFKDLVHKLHEKYEKQVVILIDEYDKPIIDYLDKESIHKAKENKDILKSFYSILKDADPYLKLVFITGVSKFSQVSIFSDLNNLVDITLRKDYNEICGISQAELELNFMKEMKIYDNEKIKEWYNGYRWHIAGSKMYNPFSLLNFFSDGSFSNYWYQTGTPTFLMKIGRDLGLYEIKDVVLSEAMMNSFNIDNIPLIPVLFQTGYLTITGFEDVFNTYNLDFPNKEVKSAYTEGLLEVYGHHDQPIAGKTLVDLSKSLKNKDSELLEATINQIFTHIPYPLWREKSEHFYHAIIHLLFSLMGTYIHSEVHTKDGRADAIIIIDEGVFCLEFKLDKTAQAAVDQVREKGYLDSYLDKSKPCHIIGINFSSEGKKVEELIWEEV